VSGKLNDLEKEVILILSRRIRAMWSDIKSDVDDRFKKQYSGSGFDVIFSRSLKRLIEKGVIWKHSFGGSVRPGYWITAKGSVLANKIQYGLSVEDIYRDEVLAFGYVLQHLRDDAVIFCMGNSVLDYFTHFKESLMELDLEKFIEEIKLYDMIIESDEDPLGLAGLV